MRIGSALEKINIQEEEIMTAKEENTLKEYTTGDLQRFINQKSQEETQKEATVKEETLETPVETVEQSKEVEKAELDINTNKIPTLKPMPTHEKSQDINGHNVELSYGERRENFIKKLKENGIDTTTFEKGYVDIVKAIDSDKFLRLKAIKPRKNQMNYKLIEILEDGTSDELENNKTILNPSDVELETSKVDDILMGMQGYYGDVQQNIKSDMSQIAKYRLLKPVVADLDVLNGEQIV